MIIDLNQNFGILGANLILIFMNKILILGSNGMLGTMVSEYFLNINEYEIFLTNRAVESSDKNNKIYKFDALNDDLESLIQDIKPNYLINCIGVIKPEINENNKDSIERAIKINTYFPLSLSKLAEVYKFKFIQIGTDCVYSGNKGNYKESSFQDANDVYGKTKIGGEVENNMKYLIRGSIVGPEIGKGKSLLNWFLNQKNPMVNGFDDHMWNGITTLNFAKIAHGMIKNNNFEFHIQHIVPKDQVSKYNLLKYFKKYFDVDVEIEKINSSESVNRTLMTDNEEGNINLWMNAGYSEVPTVEENIKELSESNITKGILNKA
jgi:dTDP-4-dehydrorhamnose reductase